MEHTEIGGPDLALWPWFAKLCSLKINLATHSCDFDYVLQYVNHRIYNILLQSLVFNRSDLHSAWKLRYRK